MSDTPKQYADRDRRALSEHYYRHISAMTIEEVMRLAHQAAQEHATLLNWRRLEAALQALVAQARDDALQEAAQVCEAESLIDPLNTSDDVAYMCAIDDCVNAIRARIAARRAIAQEGKG